MEASLFDAAIVGAGAYGTVYRAHWRGREVAVKVLHNMHDDNALHAFAKELEFGLKLQSCPSFCRLLGACLERPHVCVISEYLPGEQAHACLRKPPVGAMECLMIKY